MSSRLRVKRQVDTLMSDSTTATFSFLCLTIKQRPSLWNDDYKRGYFEIVIPLQVQQRSSLNCYIHSVLLHIVMFAFSAYASFHGLLHLQIFFLYSSTAKTYHIIHIIYISYASCEFWYQNNTIGSSAIKMWWK